MSKIVGYSSKQDDGEFWNNVEIDQPVDYIFRNISEIDIDYDLLLDRLSGIITTPYHINRKMGGYRSSIMSLDFLSRQKYQALTSQSLLDSILKNTEVGQTKLSSFYWVLGYYIRKNSDFLNDIARLILERETNKLKTSRETIVDHNSIDYFDYMEKVIEARRRILKGVLNSVKKVVELSKYYLSVIDRTTYKDSKATVFSKIFVTNPIKKRIMSNLSINDDESFSVKNTIDSKSETLNFITMKQTKNHKIIDPEKSIHYVSYKENCLFLRLRKDREKVQREFSNEIWSECVDKKNACLRPEQINQKSYRDSFNIVRTGVILKHLNFAIDTKLKKQNNKHVDKKALKVALKKRIQDI